LPALVFVMPSMAGFVLEMLPDPVSGCVPCTPAPPVTEAKVAFFDPKFAVVGLRVSLLFSRNSPLNLKA
jgi:hypothetical protein